MANQVKLITKKSDNISDWYNDVIKAAKLADHGPARGTMIIRPYGYAIWEAMQRNLDIKIKDLGAQNVYFPSLIPYSFLQKEKTHVKGFAPEVAVVTHGGGEELTEPLVVRPTSETIMYDAFSRWISSYRDLPLAINQWCNVVRWEKRPYLFLRTTEFLWQEGHTAHASSEEAQKMVDSALSMYVNFYQEDLALFGYAGRKSETEKFAGASASFSYEILMPDGKIVQSCTSHNLGQNFAKAFNVQFQNQSGQKEYVHQTSWGFSTRSIGPLIAVHGDDNGLVLPPQIAPLQVAIIPILSKSADITKIKELNQKAFEILEGHNIKVRINDSDQSPGWKFSQYDLEGVPLRIEIGGSETEKQTLRVVRRDTKEGIDIPLKEAGEKVEKILETIQNDLFEKSKRFTIANTREARTYSDFKEIMNTTKGFISAFWCEDPHCEEMIKQETKASTRVLPLGEIESSGACIYCEKPAKYRWLFGQSY